MVTETREETYTSWYSGFASYGVGAWPRSGRRFSGTRQGTSPATGTTRRDSGPLPVDERRNQSEQGRSDGQHDGRPPKVVYGGVDSSPQGKQRAAPARSAGKWGPSSLHPGVVQHGWGDGRGRALTDTVDPDMYLH